VKVRLQNVGRLVMAGALAAGLRSTGVAASAQTTSAPALTTTANATNVPTATVDSKAQRQAEPEKANADARGAEFRFLGTSL
jgi:hypothetical protein